jgi:hypothetical protein
MLRSERKQGKSDHFCIGPLMNREQKASMIVLVAAAVLVAIFCALLFGGS